MTVAFVAEQTLEELPVASIRESSTNPRRSFDEAALAELSASIAEMGVQQPLLVRPYPHDDGEAFTHEIVAGARRLRAAIRAGKVTVPCLVREIEDDEVREIQIVENLQRADVDPLEEAEAFDELLKRLGSIPAVAQKLGKEQSYVAKLLRLTSLSLASRDALRARLITIDHALLLARLAEAEQNAALKWCLNTNAGVKGSVEKVIAERIADVASIEKRKAESTSRFFYADWEPQSVVKLTAFIKAESGILLSRAPWSLTDEDYLLPDVGPCSECPSNTRANSPLFGDLQMGEATCTNGACFQAKTDGFVRIQMRSGEGVAAPVRLSWKSSSVKPSITSMPMRSDATRQHETANPAKVLKCGQWIDAKPGSCANVRPGITVDWSDAGDRGYMGGEKKLRKPGELVHVCIAVGCKTHPKAWEWQKASTVQNGKTQQEREAENAAQEKLEKQIAATEPKVRTLIFQAIVRKLGSSKALRMANDARREAPEIRKAVLGCLPEIGSDELEMLTAFGCSQSRSLSVNAYYMSRGNVADDRSDLWKLAKSAGVDPNQIAAKAFHDGLTPSLTCLYPKGVPWPKASQPSAAKEAAATKTAAKKAVAKKAAKTAAKGQKSKPAKLTPEQRKKIAGAMKKRFSDAKKAVAKKGAA